MCPVTSAKLDLVHSYSEHRLSSEMSPFVLLVASCRHRKADTSSRALASVGAGTRAGGPLFRVGWQRPQMPHPCPKPALPAANCTAPDAVFVSVFPQTWHVHGVGGGFFLPLKQQMETNSERFCLPSPPPSRGTRQSGVMRALVHMWISFPSKLVGWSRTVF